MNDRQLGDRLRRAFEVEQPPSLSAAEIRQRAQARHLEPAYAEMPSYKLPWTRLGRPVGAVQGSGMATDPGNWDKRRQQQELEEIRRSFAERGARMGSLFEPVETDPDEAPAAPARATTPVRARWLAVAALALLLAGGVLGYILPWDQSRDSASPRTSAATLATRADELAAPTTPLGQTKASAMDSCLRVAELGDQIIARLQGQEPDHRLHALLEQYTIASQACRKEASP